MNRTKILMVVIIGLALLGVALRWSVVSAATMQERGQGARPSQAAGAGRYYALLIAVQNYRHPGVTTLDYPVADAQRVRQVLTADYNFDPQDVTLLRDSDRDAILTSLERLAEKLRPDDHLLIFYAGHGYWDEQRRQGYWLPANAQRGRRADWISNSDLRDAIRAIRARHTLLVSDACFSGGIFVAREAFARSAAIEELNRLPSRNAMTSGALTTVPDRSVFVEYLLKRLGENREPYLPAADLFSQLRTPVINNSPRQADGSIPTPRYGVIQEAGDEGGDFIFVRREVSSTPPPRPTPALPEEQSAWERAKARRTAEAVRAFLSLYPNSKFENEARDLLATLEPAKPSVRMSAAGVALALLSPFTTVTVDANGKIVDRRPNQESWGYVEDLGNGVKLEMVEIPAGEFLMGEDAAGAADYEKECVRYWNKDDCARWAKYQTPQRRVKLNGFLMGKYEVTQKQWVAVMGGLPPSMASLGNEFKGDDLPVVNVSWEEAQEFIRRLNEKLKLSRSVYRLPSEAEWEYAARAGTRTPYAFGETISPDTANYWWDKPHRNAPEKKNLGHPVKVGSYPANAFGLFDLHGNVWEWCEDDWHDSYTGAPADGRAWVDSPSRGSYRVSRGGGWGNGAVGCRSALRINVAPGYRYVNLGFRLLRTYR
jgi:formylglycine-generating enzyme required for sulfatase activity